MERMDNNKMLSLTMRIVFVALFFQGATSVQRFERHPSYTEVNPGSDTHLECKVFNKRGSCSWQKDNKPVGMYLNKYEWVSSNQQNGECSIWIRAAQLEFDDGNWECQVTASDFHTQDALTSHPVRLVVRVAPQRPRVEFNGTQILPGHNLTAMHGEVATIKCVSHYGNPPAILKWFLDQQEITPARRQTNTTELDNPKTWLAVSVLELTISKENHGRTLSCVAVHESYATKSSTIDVRLDVMFVPETRLVGIPTTDIEDLKDSIAIRCVVSANPRASVTWRREGQNQPASLQELLQFSPAVRQHSGLYTCHARNKAGEAVPIRVQIDVKYRPRILAVGDEKVKTASLFAPVNFDCTAEGNPPPTYQWIQTKTSPHSHSVIERGREAKLYINNATYEYQGEWRCKVTNIIKGQEQSVVSDPIILQVHGAPQIVRPSSVHEVLVESGQSADLRVDVCADPRPRTVSWEWGSSRLEAGQSSGEKFTADQVVQEEDEDCYSTTLHIKDASAIDSRTYYVVVVNDKGKDAHAVQLYVNDPLQMSTLVSVAGALLVAFLIMVCVCIYVIRAEKCCFSRKGDFKPSDIDSQKLDIEKTGSHHHHHHNQQQQHHPPLHFHPNQNSQTTPPSSLGPGGIPADAIYTTGPRSATHPDAMKLQLPTTTTTRTTITITNKPTKPPTTTTTTTTTSTTTTKPTTHTTTFDGRSSYEEPQPLHRYRGNVPTSEDYDRYYGFSRYELPKPNDNWSYASTTIAAPYDRNYHDKRSSRKRHKKEINGNRSRPKPLQLENEQYYDLVFPRARWLGEGYDRRYDGFRVNSLLDRAEL